MGSTDTDQQVLRDHANWPFDVLVLSFFNDGEDDATYRAIWLKPEAGELADQELVDALGARILEGHEDKVFNGTYVIRDKDEAWAWLDHIEETNRQWELENGHT